MEFIRSTDIGPGARIVDVGGGASTLADDLLAEGYRNVAVVDIAESALAATRARLGERAEKIDWITGDITRDVLPAQSIDFWHDRAVFHFLTSPRDRAAYREQLLRCLKPGGFALIATFALDGPEKCSGLPTVRYDAASLLAELGDAFEHAEEASELHEKPSGGVQSFMYCLCKRRV